MFVYSRKLALVFLAIAPALRRPDALLGEAAAARCTTTSRRRTASYPSGQIDAIRGIETVKALAAEDALRQLMLAQFQALADRRLPHGLPRARLPGRRCSWSRSPRLALFLLVGSIAGRARAPLDRRVRRLQRACCARERAAAEPALALGPGQLARVLLGRLDDVLEPEPEQGSDRARLRTVRTPRGPRRAAQRRLSLRRAGVAGDPRRHHARRAAGRDGGDRRAERLRQDDADQAAWRACSSRPRATILFDGVDMRTLDYRDAAPADRLRAAGELSLQRLDRAPTSPSASGEPDHRRGSAGPRRSRTRTSSSSGCRSATTRASASPACASRAASSSASRSPGRSTTARRSCSSTRRRARSTPSRSAR